MANTGEPYHIDLVKFRSVPAIVTKNVSVLTTVTEVLLARDDRNWVHLRNLGTTSMWIGFDETAAGSCAVGTGLRLDKLGGVMDHFEFGVGILPPAIVGNIYAISGATATALSVNYFQEVRASYSPSISPSLSPSISPSYSSSISPSLSPSLSTSLSPSLSASLSPSLSPSISPSPS